MNVTTTASTCLFLACLTVAFSGVEPTSAQSITPGDLVINEILYAPPASEQEFVELLNLSNRSLNLCFLLFSDDRDAAVSLCEDAIELLPDSFVVIARDSIALRQAFPAFSGRIVSPGSWPALNNSGDAVKILVDDVSIDEVAYSPAWGGAGVSLERKDPGAPSQAAFNWGSSLASQGATPGMQNSIYGPDRSPPGLFLAEVNGPDTVILFWNEAIETESVTASMFTAAGDAPHTLKWISPVESHLYFSTAIRADEIVYAGVADLSGNRTPEMAHQLAFPPGQNDLLVNEIMYEPLADAFDGEPDQTEYVELYNASNRLLSLRRLALSGKADEFNAADTLRSTTPFPTALPASHVVIYANTGAPADHVSILELAFPSIDFRSEFVTLLPIDGATLGLSNAGDVVSITNDGTPIDAVIYSPDWHHPILAETRGISLERRSRDADSGLGTNWSSAVAEDGGTPGAINSTVVGGPISSDTAFSVDPCIFSPDGDGVDDVLPIHFASSRDSQVLDIKAFDMQGRLVRTVVESAIVGREATFFWDGYGNDGRLLPVGLYIVTLEALNVRDGETRFFKKPAILALPLE